MNIQLVRTPVWRWSVCVVLLLATLLLYMDRMTITQLSNEIISEFGLDEADYGTLDAVFSVAFALGALIAGFMADRWNVWWLYPAAVFAWSLAGAATGLVPAGSFLALLLCRFALGFAESFHWPCALRTTQRLFPPDQRTLSNSILQSGAAVGAILTPLVILVLMFLTGSWRHPFVIIGSLGLGWVVLWLLLVKEGDMANDPATMAANPFTGLWDEFLLPLLTDRRFYILLPVAICINNTWHFFRVWLPRVLTNSYGFGQEGIQYFSSAYYFAADVGSLAIGFGSLTLVRLGMSVHGSRMAVFALCAALATLSVLVAFLPHGVLVMVILLVIGFAALGLFPPYYSLTQEITNKHQGKVTGLLGCLIWLAMAAQRYAEGQITRITGNYDFGLFVAAASPLVGVVILWLFWPTTKPPPLPSALPEEMATGIMDRGHAMAIRQQQTGIMPADNPSPPAAKE